MRHARRPLALQRLEPRVVLDASALRITEFVASNNDSLADFDGDSPDWLEIYNPSSATVDLNGLYLTDDDEEPTQWPFPAGAELPAGGYLVVFASNKDTVMPNGELHTNFALSAGGEYLGLYAADGFTPIDEFAPEYPEQSEDVSYGLAMQPTGATSTLLASGATGKAWRPTSSIYDTTWTAPDFDDTPFNLEGPTGFGYESSPGGTVDYSSHIETTVPGGTTSLYLRLSFDVSTLAGIDQLTLRMRYDDGFVAYLNGVPVADANAPEGVQWNATSTANHEDPDAVVFQEFDVSAGIPALVEGQNVLAIHGLNVSSTSSDFLIDPELVAESYEIVAPDEFGFSETPTPGYGNAPVFAGFAAEPAFSVPHGFYTAPQQVAITSDTPDATIVYTTDGSMPSVDANLNPVNGSLYTGPIAVAGTQAIRAVTFKQGFKPSFVRTSSYVFLDDVVDQSPQGQTPGPGWASNGVNGQEINYGIDPDIINLYGEQAVKDALSAIPTIALTTDLDNLFDPATGIYVNAGNRGRDWEREASVELINPDGSEGFTANAGLRIRGGYSRNDFNPKHAFRLYFRGDYGDSRLDYPLFGDDGVDEFDVLDLRTAQNYSWSSEGNTQNTFLREVFARDTQAALGHEHTRSEYYHLYLDGHYWGVFMTQERVEEFYGESYFGGDETDYDVVKSDLAVSGGTEIADGNDIAWRQLFDLAQDLADNPGSQDNYWTMQGLDPDGARNESLPVLLDVENLIDYMLIIFYTGGYDTGLSQFLGNDRANNWFGIYNRVTADTGFQFFLHDNEHSLGAAGNTHGSLSIDRTGPFLSGNDRVFSQFNPHFLHQDLLSHPEYRQKFIDRVQSAMFNDGALTVDQSIARLLERKAEVDPAIIAEAARWGDSKVFTPRNKAIWQSEVDWLTATYFPARGNIVLNQLRGDELFTNFAAPVFSQHGGPIDPGFQLSISSGPGTVYYTTDGETDPRLIGGGVNNSGAVATYTGPITLTGDTTVWARLRTASGEWSGLVEASFDAVGLPGDYDSNGLVEQADRDLWRATYGSTTDLRADGNGDGQIDAADYSLWRDAFDAAPPAVAFATTSTDLAPDQEASPQGPVTLVVVAGAPTPDSRQVRYRPSVRVDASPSDHAFALLLANDPPTAEYADPADEAFANIGATDPARDSVEGPNRVLAPRVGLRSGWDPAV